MLINSTKAEHLCQKSFEIIKYENKLQDCEHAEVSTQESAVITEGHFNKKCPNTEPNMVLQDDKGELKLKFTLPISLMIYSAVQIDSLYRY